MDKSVSGTIPFMKANFWLNYQGAKWTPGSHTKNYAAKSEKNLFLFKVQNLKLNIKVSKYSTAIH